MDQIIKLKISELTTERKWRSATGMNKERFNKLLELFSLSYQETHGKSIEDKQAAEKRNEKIPDYAITDIPPFVANPTICMFVIFLTYSD
jgi:hypothetical protein